MLEVVFLGHASLVIRGQGSLLCDPIFGATVSGGGNLINPPRSIVLDQLEEVDGVLLTHHHSDHFDIQELDRVPSLAHKPFIVPAGSSAVEALRRHGYNQIQEVNLGDQIHLAGVDITVTESNVPFPEVGYYFKRGEAGILNLADTVFHDSVESLCGMMKHPALVLAPFQSGGYMSLLPLRIGGVPSGLEEAIQTWSNGYLEELSRDIATLSPLAVVPFADGICYLDEGINHWHFPLPDSAFSQAMASYGCPVEIPTPGGTYRVDTNKVTFIGVDHKLVRRIGVAVSRIFNSSWQLADRPRPCSKPEASVVKISPMKVLPCLTDNLRTYMKTMITTAHEHDFLKTVCQQWELELCDNDDSDYPCIRMSLGDMDGRALVQMQCTQEQCTQEQRPYGIRAHWCDIARVLSGDMPLEYIEMSGAFRYKCPDVIDDLENIRHRVLWPFQVLIDPKNAPPPP